MSYKPTVQASVHVSDTPSYPSYTMIVPCAPKDLLRVFFMEPGHKGMIEISNFIRLETLPNHIQRLVAEHVTDIKIAADKVALEDIIKDLPTETVAASEDPIDLSEYIPKD